jgi:hypothetical protein
VAGVLKVKSGDTAAINTNFIERENMKIKTNVGE